jgi:hypothetical protein
MQSSEAGFAKICIFFAFDLPAPYQQCNQINQQTHRAANNRPIDADKLQITPNVEFHAVGHRIGIPLFDGIADNGSDFTFAANNDIKQDILKPRVNAISDGLVVQKRIRERL